MTAGRKPLPTALKVLRGNPGKRPLNANEAKPEAAIPDLPPHVEADEIAKAEWIRITPELARAGLLTRIDRAALAAYCLCWSRWVNAESKVREMGAIVKAPRTKFPVMNPYLAVANKAMAEMKAFLVEFGMTPASRSRIDAAPPEREDPFAAFLARNQRGRANDAD